LSRYTRELGQVWRIAEISTKPFPSGRASHAALGPLQSLTGQAIERIELACPPLIHRLVGRPYRPDMTPAYARLCLPFLAALMLTDGRIDPRRFTPENFADPALAALAGKVVLVADGNQDPNALFPQELRITLAGGAMQAIAVPHTLGSPDAPLSPAQTQAKLEFARELAPAGHDPRLFSDPLTYFTDPT
jgi:2-methylcitrate dehydratase PrpD